MGFKDIKYDKCVIAHDTLLTCVSSDSTGPHIQDNLLTKHLGSPLDAIFGVFGEYKGWKDELIFIFRLYEIKAISFSTVELIFGILD